MRRFLSASILAVLLGCSTAPQADSPKDEEGVGRAGFVPDDSDEEGVGRAGGPAAAGWVVVHVVPVVLESLLHWAGTELEHVIADVLTDHRDSLTECRKIYFDRRYPTIERCSSPNSPKKCPRARKPFTGKTHDYHVQFEHFAYGKKQAYYDDEVNSNWRPVMRAAMRGIRCGRCGQCFDDIPRTSGGFSISKKEPKGKSFGPCSYHLDHEYFQEVECSHPKGNKAWKAG